MSENECRKGSKPVDFAFIQLIRCMKTFSNVDEGLGYMCVTWSLPDDLGHTFGTWVDAKATKRLRVREWLGVALVDSMEGAMTVVYSTLGLKTLLKRSALDSPMVIC